MQAESVLPDEPELPKTRAECQRQIAGLRDDIAAIKAQIAAADIDRQAAGGTHDARWFHRAKTALRHRQRELDARVAHMATLPDQRRDAFKDCVIAVVREDYDDQEWQEVLEEARRRQAAQQVA